MAWSESAPTVDPAEVPEPDPNRGDRREQGPSDDLPAGLWSRVVEHFRFDWPGWLAMIFATGLYLFTGFGGNLSRDTGVYTYAGERMVDGVAPYLGILNRAGPLASFVPGVGIWIGDWLGINPVLAARLTFMVISVAAIGAAYLAARMLWSSRLGGTAAAFALLSFQGFAQYATWGPREKSLMILFVLVSMIAIKRQAWLTAGGAIALATLTWQPAFFPTMLAVIVAVALGVPGLGAKGRALLRVIIGGAVPTAIVVAAYAAIGHLRDFIDCFYLINSRYTEQATFFDNMSLHIRHLEEGYGLSIWVILAGTIALLVASTRALLRSDRGEPDQAAIVAAGAVLIGAVAWSLVAFQNWPDLFVLLPPAAVGFGWPFSGWGERRATPALAATLVAVLLLGASATSFALDHRGSRGLAQQRAIVNGALQALPADADLLSVNSPQWLAVANRPSLSKIQMFGSDFDKYVDDTYPGGLEGYARDMSAKAPALIIYTPGDFSRHWIPTLLADYERVASTGKTEWYVRNDLDPASKKAVSDAIKRARSAYGHRKTA